ncbi:MAG: hypothetical protein KAH23_03720 [Kiritimatiellae bacterium]|nr:hypothetical protein [Kiritimatiellia bacterium]
MGIDKHKNVGNRIIRAGLIVSIAHAVFKIVGLVQAIAVGRCLDSATYDVAYAFAFEGIIFSVFLIGEEVIGPAFLPVFMREFEKNGEKSAWRFANIVLTIQAIILFIVIVLIMQFPDLFVRVCTVWGGAADESKRSLASATVRCLAPSLFFLSLGSTTYMILNGYKKFFFAAFGDASWRICVVIAIIAGALIFDEGYVAVVFGLVVGSAAKMATHLIGLAKKMKYCGFSLRIGNPVFRRMLMLMLPLIVGILFAKVRDIFNNVTILSYLHTDGLMKANSLGRKPFTALAWLVPYALSIAMFPFLCEMVDNKDKKRLGEIVTQTSRMLLSVFIPFALFCAALSVPVAGIIFSGGKFTAEVTYWSGISMACYILVLPAYALEQILIQVYFANRKMISVTVMGILFSSFSVAISYVGIVKYGLRGAQALAVVALGFVLSRTLKSIAFVGIMKRSISMFPGQETVSFILRCLLNGVLVGGSAWLSSRMFEMVVSSSSKIVLMAKLCVAGTVGVVVFVVSLMILKIREPGMMLMWTWEKIRHGRREGSR